MIFSPADHFVIDITKFKQVIREALKFTHEHDAIVTLGMRPTRPETGYGYIKAIASDKAICKVEAFKEKPNREIAEQYMADGSYFWNAGIFVWKVNMVIRELEEQTPALAAKFQELSRVFFTSQEQEIIDREFPTCESISIDYEVMEKSKRTYFYPASFWWGELGTLGSLYTLLGKDADQNAIVGEEVKMVECEDCIVHAPQERKIVVQGLKDYIIAEHDDTLLICMKSEEQRIKEFSI